MVKLLLHQIAQEYNAKLGLIQLILNVFKELLLTLTLVCVLNVEMFIIVKTVMTMDASVVIMEKPLIATTDVLLDHRIDYSIYLTILFYIFSLFIFRIRINILVKDSKI